MALDVRCAAILAANVLYLHHRAGDNSRPRPPFWTGEALGKAEELRELLNVNLTNDDTSDSLAVLLRTRLEEDAILSQRLERKYPSIIFAQLIDVLAQKVATMLALQPPPGEPPDVVEVLAKLRQLIAGVPVDVRVLQTVLFFNDHLAGETALAFEEALPFPWTLALELEAVSASRTLRDVKPQDATQQNEAQLIGLAFSGGGIRSATLNLGIAQALAELKLLPYFDYLSTVSGGGYIGSWLHAWIWRSKKTEDVPEALSPQDSPDPESVATQPIKWLRQYSNYLAPRRGFFSVDSWSIVAIWARNTLLNLVVIVLALSALLMVPRGAMIVFDVVHRHSVWAWIGLVPLAVAVVMIQQNLHSFGEKYARTNEFQFQQKGIHSLVVLPVFLSAILVAAWLFEVRKGRASFLLTDLLVSGSFFVLLCFVSFFGDYHRNFFDEASPPPGRVSGWTTFTVAVLFFNGICAAVGGLLLIVVDRLFRLWDGDGAEWHDLVWGTLAISAVYSLVIILHLGLFGRNLPEDRREWWSRAGAVLSLWLLAWVAIAGTAIYGPWIVVKLSRLPYGSYLETLLASSWVGTTLAGVLKAHGDQTGTKTSDPLSDLLARIAPPVFVGGLLLLLSFGVHMVTIALFGFGFAGMERMDTAHFDFLSWWPPGDAWLAAAVCLGVAMLLSSRVDLNQFSMHNFYENRLVRCYLGASRRRKPNRFTGFDPDDDLALACLSPMDPTAPYGGPYPIFNATLNLVSGEELAWQERKAEAFSFTPQFSGFAATPTEERGGPHERKGIALHGYRPTEHYAFPKKGIRVGRAVAISGAAVSPNWGFHTAPATAFLLTVFNVRLGSWIGNPRDEIRWRRSSPRFGLGYLLVELAGAANGKSKYVYLSDGGHFENLGIYELIRRKCRYIIACDGGQDAAFIFDDLGNAIRKCRADFGVEIDIHLDSLLPKVDGSATARRPLSGTHCAVGTITYTDAPSGILIYLKASLTGDEPADVLEYAAIHPEFPHQTTADQFFDESQFESYRKLGYHIGKSVFAEAAQHRLKTPGGRAAPLDSDRSRFFSDLRQRWRASSPNTAASFTRHAEALVKLMRRLREDPDLEFLDTQMTPEWERLMAGASDAGRVTPAVSLGLPPKVAQRRAGFHFCNAVMQLMEDVYLDLNLETEYGHPDNAGWMNLFDHWSWSTMFRVTWMISASCYGARFRSFCEDQLRLDPASIGRIQIVPAESGDDARLNYRERGLLTSTVFQLHADEKPDRLYLLEIVVQRPDPPHADTTNLTVGVAVVSAANQLVYFRIQEHLRTMGLARRMLDAMVVDGQCLVDRKPGWRAGLTDLAERVSPENQERVERMLESAHFRRAASGGGGAQ
jgi:Patatin-like phospholipase